MSVTDTLRRAYDRDADGYDTRFHDQQRPKAEAMARLVSAPGAGRVLDVGCGTGLLRGWLVAADPAWERCAWSGLDLSSGMLAQARHLSRVQGDARKLPFARASFDRVFSLTGLVLPEDVGPALISIARVTKPGGVVALSLRRAAWPTDLSVPAPFESLADEEVEGDRLRVWRRL